MNNIFKIIILSLTILLPYYAIADEAPLSDEQINAQMKEMANKINRQLPRKVDDILTLERIEYDNKVFSYFYKIDDLNKLKNLSSIESDTNKTTCKTMNQVINEQGFSYHYNYVAPNNEQLLDFIINKNSCNKFK